VYTQSEKNDSSVCEGDSLPGSQIRRDLQVHLAAVTVEVFGTPVVVSALRGRRFLRPCILEDLEEATGAIRGAGVADLGHVHEDGSIMSPSDSLSRARSVARLLVHFNGDGIAGSYAAF
jgi:hypothetical protein